MGYVMYMHRGEFLTGIKSSELSVGSTVYLNENGSPVEYLIVNQGIPSNSSLYDSSCNGTWLLRKESHNQMSWDSEDHDYENSDVHLYLNENFISLFDTNVRSAIKSVKIPYVKGKYPSQTIETGNNGLFSKVFLLGGYEVGCTTSDYSYLPIDGACLDYFLGCTKIDSKRIAYRDGLSTNWHLRSPTKTSGYVIHVHYANGSLTSNIISQTNNINIRPALILPSNTVFDKDTLTFKGVG